MSRIVDITDKFDSSRPTIKIGEKSYEVDNSLQNVLKFKNSEGQDIDQLLELLKGTLGKEACDEIGVVNLPMSSFKVLMNAIGAAMQDVDYEEVEKRTSTPR